MEVLEWEGQREEGGSSCSLGEGPAGSVQYEYEGGHPHTKKGRHNTFKYERPPSVVKSVQAIHCKASQSRHGKFPYNTFSLLAISALFNVSIRVSLPNKYPV